MKLKDFLLINKFIKYVQTVNMDVMTLMMQLKIIDLKIYSFMINNKTYV